MDEAGVCGGLRKGVLRNGTFPSTPYTQSTKAGEDSHTHQPHPFWAVAKTIQSALEGS
ncbi:hypothetical protein lbkm_2580 [Lachnospiraceae bacterium KM106-2]|nr:hypothetical protein lbkm_2580 [Lachnospiraceae bacterium KM106-2]